MSGFDSLYAQLANHSSLEHDGWTRLDNGELFIVYRGSRVRVASYKDGWRFRIMIPGNSEPSFVSESYPGEGQAQFEAIHHLERVRLLQN